MIYRRRITLKIIFLLVLFLLIIGTLVTTVRIVSNRSESQDIRSQAEEETKKIYPQSVRCLNENLACQISGETPTNTIVGLYAPPGASCDTKKHCEKIDNKYVTSCAVYDFGKTYIEPIIVKYTQTQQVIAGDSCVGQYCGTFPGFGVFTSQDNQT